MSDAITRTPLKPRDIRRRAYALMKQCWKTLLVAAVLMSLFGWVGEAIESRGEGLAQQAYDAHMEAFYAENPPPEDTENRIEWAYFYEWLAIHQAEDVYDDIFAPWEWAVRGIDLIDLLFTCIIAVRLCGGLLSAIRGGECTPQCLLSGWTRTSTTCWLAIQTTLRVLGWSLLPLIIYATLVHVFGDKASLVSSALMTLVAIWATLHYALAEVHLADAPDGSRTASDCLRLAVDDADTFGIWQMCKVLWPLAIISALESAIRIAALFVPALGMLITGYDMLSGLLFIVLQYSCYVCMYDEIRQRAFAASSAVPENKGLARARALAQEESAN